MLEKAGGDKMLYNLTFGVDVILVGYIVAGQFITATYYPHQFQFSVWASAIYLVAKKQANQISKKAIPIEKEEPLKKEIASFVDCVINKKRPVVSGEDAKDALRVALEIQNQIWKNI